MQKIDQWVFLTNFEKKKETHIRACCAIANIDSSKYCIEKKALDIYGRLILETYALYINPEIYQSKTNIFDISHQLQNTYKLALLKAGLITNEFAETHSCYIGIEKELGIKFNPQQIFQL